MVQTTRWQTDFLQSHEAHLSATRGLQRQIGQRGAAIYGRRVN